MAVAPEQSRSLYAIMPTALQRRLPRMPSIHRLLLYKNRTLSVSSPDLRQGLVTVPKSQRDLGELSTRYGSDFPRPSTADSVESANSSASSACGQNPVTPISQDDVVAVSHYEAESGLGWNHVVPAFNILRSAGYEAQQTHPDPQLIRSLYINGLVYLLEALPPDLTGNELETIQKHLPEQMYTKPDTPGNQRPGNPFITRNYASLQPSYIHRFLSAVIICGFLLARFLLPYAKAILQYIYQYERSHRITERLVAATLEVADDLANNGTNSGTTAVSYRQGKMAAAASGVTSWLIEGITGGICEGVGEGMAIIGLQPQTLRQRSK